MHSPHDSNRPSLRTALAATAFALAAYANATLAEDIKVVLSGANEVPPVTTAATGAGTITVNTDMTVSGMVLTTGVAGTMAHIHLAGAGKNGPVIIPLTRGAENAWAVPAGATLSSEQYKAFRAGDLYVNVHSAENKGGEIRAQLKP
jgi:hypothetical protein